MSEILGPAAESEVALRRNYTRMAAFFERHEGLRAVALVVGSAVASEVILQTLARALFFDRGWAVYWPMTGIVAAVLLTNDRRRWPWVLLGFLLDQLYHFRHFTDAENLVFLACNLTEVLIAALSLPRFHNLADWVKEPQLLKKMVVWPILVGPAATAMPVALFYSRVMHRSFWEYATRWGFGDTLGTVLWLPLMLVMMSRETYDLFRWKSLPKTAGLLGLAVAVSEIVFHLGYLHGTFVIMPILVLIALKLRFSGSVLAVNLFAAIATQATLAGHGPLHWSGGQIDVYSVATLQIFLLLSMLTCFPISVVLLERAAFETGLKTALWQMEVLAAQDGLTGVANRRRFNDALKEEWRRALRERHSLALLMIDVDYFKKYNDNYGHLGGDGCLRCVAQAILMLPNRAGDLVARYGGEEFAVLLPRTDTAGAAEMANRVRFAVESLAMEHAQNPHGLVTVSIGSGSLIPTLDLDAETLIQGVDAALYAAKRNGRNRVESWNAQPVSEEKPVLSTR